MMLWWIRDLTCPFLVEFFRGFCVLFKFLVPFEFTVMETFDQCLADAKSTDVFNFYSVKYARFLSKDNNYEKARDVLRDAIKKDKGQFGCVCISSK